MNERSPHAIWKAKGAAKLPPGIDLQSGRNDLNPKRRGLTVSLAITCGSVVIYGRRTLSGEPFKLVNRRPSQTLAVIVPPVEPSPKGRGNGSDRRFEKWVRPEVVHFRVPCRLPDLLVGAAGQLFHGCTHAQIKG